YLLERSALDELALSETIGATSEPWPLVAQLVRRASFDVLAAYTERVQLEPNEAAIVDKLTTVHTRPLFDAVLAKELERAGAVGHVIDPERLRADAETGVERAKQAGRNRVVRLDGYSGKQPPAATP